MEQLDQAVKCEFPLRTSILTNDTGDESSWGIPMVTADGEIIEEGDSPPPSALEGHAKAVSEDAKLQYIWRDTMKDYGFAGKPHRRVSVLMISWHGKLDDLETMGEVNALEDVWRNDFNYEVVKKELVEGKRPGIQLIKHLADFVFEYEGDSALLIVYYAGHGIPGPPGELHLAGKRQPNIKHSIDNAVAWHESEHIIRDAKADVLLIFDCCYAGNLLTRNVRSYYQTRSYETLAACGRREVTNPPGEDSFTSALIWALKDLLKERKRFTITELQTRIMNGAPNFPKAQFVPLLERHDPCDQRLILAPLPSGLEAESPISTPSTQTLDLRQNYLDLRFWFATRPNEEEIRNLAMRLRRDMMDKNIGAHSIGWLALKNVDLVRSEKEVARNVAKHWRWVARQKSHIQPSLVNGGEGPSEPKAQSMVTILKFDSSPV
ncbi:hypothetical protein DL95DRAFT_457032 [Leptodontidium sp. 2 PMI_412]|nr:hypothetical protein DL95DRAFT_457032 [Leptodontidium sp. 2 PMI_412]